MRPCRGERTWSTSGRVKAQTSGEKDNQKVRAAHLSLVIGPAPWELKIMSIALQSLAACDFSFPKMGM